MNTRILISVLAGATAVMVIALAPATLLTSRLAGAAALRVTEAEGSVWRGRVGLAIAQGRRLGDFRVGLSPLALLTGQVRLKATDKAAGRAFVLRWGRDRGVEGLTGPLSLELEGLSGRIEAKDVVALFRDGRCRRAGGHIRFRAAQDSLLGGATLAGTPACVGGDWVTRLAPTGGAGAAITLRADGAGRLQAETAVATADPLLVQAALDKGFVKDAAGVRRVVSTRLSAEKAVKRP
ncbi:type II secretion system protein N [Caulobacter endophyticus]|uniref:type II secretion system protein N n=1 Tax=Caulobacter endophyticus TaxID=2172652 RepID=UPI00240FF5E4|nr:type II secretion system protein N [Caulobacter endophyticus]MDG2531397.1 type II secretion system protein N [Caulobacter endophyticus]